MKDEDYASCLIRKGNYYYRPRCQGYTVSKLDAGRYTPMQAKREAAVEPENFTIEIAPECVGGGIGDEINRLLRRGG